MHAIIIGGGIAGPLAAIAVRELGGTATVYEAHGQSTGANVGAWLTLAVNGIAALAALGVAAPIVAQGFPSRHIELCSGDGKVLGVVPIGGELDDGTVTHTLRRSDLYRTIAELAHDRGVRFEHGKKLLDADVVTNGRARAIFADGSQAHGDLLVGADGVHSVVRRALDPSAPQPSYAGLVNVGGFTPDDLGLAPGTYRMVFGKRAFFGFTVSPRGETWWFANLPRKRALSREELSAITQTQWRERIVAAFADDVGPMREIVERTAGTIVVTNQHELPRVPCWHRGPIGLLGDAAHAVSPSSGQGVSMAAEDVAVLAKCLAESRDPSGAFASFTSLRRDRVERVVAYGAAMNSKKIPGPIGRVFRDLMLPIFLRRVARQAADGALDWLFDYDLAHVA